LTQRVAEQARALTADEIVHGLDLLAETDREMRFTSQPRLLVELMAVRLCGSATPLGAATPEPPAAAAPAVGARPAVPSPTPTARRVPAPPPAPEPKPTEAVGEPTPSRNETETLAELRRRWEEILSALRKLRSVKIEAFLREATPTGLQEGVLTLTFRFQFHYSQMATSEERRKVLSDAIARVIGTTVTIKCELADGEEAQPPASPNQPKLIQDVLSTFPGSTVEE
jgi:DNA polymerase III gamma/tau subunit